ncbi:MAG: phosphonate ABC transporter substrate-binding protein [Deltaproteobacteria bacterium]|jgi:phosphonate transport system substrate-binding protein|nr:phosphonate ABC transporter substrate-binding protein [Deltaproteobacteria bacterium]
MPFLKFFHCVLALAVFTLILSLAPGAKAQTELNFGIISTESSQNLRPVWEPFLEDMAKETGYKINAYFATDYAGIIEGMRFNKVQLAWYGNKSAMEAVDRADGEVFMQTVNADGTAGYYSHLIVNSASPINNLDDLWRDAANLSFANGDPNSTSGFLVPGYYVFAVNGKDPKTTFKRIIIGSHEANALSVASGQVDVATCNSEAIERLKVTYPDRVKDIKIIWTSPIIPSDPLVRRVDLDPNIKKTIDDFLLAYGQRGVQRELDILNALQWKGFKRSDNNQLIPIRQLELFKEKTTLENAATGSDADKKRLAEIDQELAALGK